MRVSLAPRLGSGGVGAGEPAEGMRAGELSLLLLMGALGGYAGELEC